MSTEPVQAASVSLRQRLRDALPAAIKARDRAAVAALRATLAAIDNAEAVSRTAPVDEQLAIELIPRGVGATEVRRMELTPQQVADLVAAEVADREAAARDYDRAGQTERADMLRGEASVLSAHLAATPGGLSPTAAGTDSPSES